MNFTQADLDRIAKGNPDIGIRDQMNGEQLSAAVSGGTDGGRWVNGDTGHVSLMPPTVPTEHDEQAALFEWAKARRDGWHELWNLYANVNGQYRAGQRPEPGLMAGVPDVLLAWPTIKHHGLYIELKRQGRQGHKNGGLSDAQMDWIERLRHAGYRVAICYGGR